MKWSNKGHEFDYVAEQLQQLFCDKHKLIYVFGAGLIGIELKTVYEKTGYFAGFIDNNEEKRKNGVDGAEVLSLHEYMERGREGLIIIAADIRNIPAITEQLCRENLREGADFYIYDKFMDKVFPILLLYDKNMLYVDLAQICLTERCSLKCKKCAHGCYAVNADNQDMSLKTVKRSVDCFFHKVDFIREFVLIGGEPFLYAELDSVIEYIGEKYRDKMQIFSITTNGTIMPRKTTLELSEKYDVLIRISNYSGTLKHLEEKYIQLQECLAENRISFVIGDKELQWMDYGFETVDRKWRTEELIQVFDKCRTPCREIRDNKYYYCVMARSVSENLKMGLGEDDFLDLDHLGDEDKKIFLEFQFGYSDKGYLDMCNHCNGRDAAMYPIPAAEQIG